MTCADSQALCFVFFNYSYLFLPGNLRVSRFIHVISDFNYYFANLGNNFTVIMTTKSKGLKLTLTCGHFVRLLYFKTIIKLRFYLVFMANRDSKFLYFIIGSDLAVSRVSLFAS